MIKKSTYDSSYTGVKEEKTCKLAVTSSARKWFTLHETAGKMKFTPNHHKALSLNQCVAEMIVGDINPFSIFKRQGLCNELECIEQNYHILSLKYISPVVLPKKGMKPGWKIKQVMLEAESGLIRITSDMWLAYQTVPCMTDSTRRWAV